MFVKPKTNVRDFASLLICLTDVPEEKRVLHVYHVQKQRDHKVPVRKWKPRKSRVSTNDRTKLVAFDLRGPTFYIADTDKVTDGTAWCDGDKGEFAISENALLVKGKGTATSIFVTKLLARYHKLSKTVKDPSKDPDMVERFSLWAESLQRSIVGSGATMTIRFAKRPFTRGTDTRTRNLRVVVPATNVQAACKCYYVRANTKNDAKYCKSCDDCDKYCLAIDVNDNHTVVEDAHVTPNLPSTSVDFFCNKA